MSYIDWERVSALHPVCVWVEHNSVSYSHYFILGYGTNTGEDLGTKSEESFSLLVR